MWTIEHIRIGQEFVHALARTRQHEEVDGAKAPLEPSTTRVGRVERIRSIIGAWLITMGTWVTPHAVPPVSRS